MWTKFTVVLGALAILATWAAIVPAQESQPTSQPVADPVRAEVVRVASVDPAAFTAALVQASADLSDAELGAYSRILIGNLQGADLVEKYSNAYDGSAANAHAMQGAAMMRLQEEYAVKAAEAQAVLKKIGMIQAEFAAYQPQE